MIPISMATLSQVLGQPVEGPAANGPITGVTIDSRADCEGKCFVAIRGEQFDGHDYVTRAAGQGAVCAIVDRELTGEVAIPLIRVDNTVEALGRLAAWHRRQLQAKVVAITGSAGKTSTRHILHQVLSRKYRCRQAQKSFNNHIGVPLTLLEAQANDEILLVEIGTNHPGEIAPLSKMASPDIAVVTHIAPAHLEGFGTIEAIIHEKASIAEGLADGGKLIINGDIPALVDWVRKSYSIPYITVGAADGCDVRAEEMHTDGLTGRLVVDGRRIDVPLAGRAGLQNTLTVWSICRFFDIALSDFIEAIRTIAPSPMRLEVRDIGPCTLLNDCYNANPASMENAIDCLARMSTAQKRRSVFIVSDMGELGAGSEALHRQVGRKAADLGIDTIAVTGRWGEAIQEGAATTDNATAKPPQVRTFGSVEALCNNLDSFVRPADIILVKASRAAKLERVVEQLEALWGPRATDGPIIVT